MSSTDRRDLGRAGPLTPVIQGCRLGGSGTPSVPTHIHAEAVTKPEERGAQPPAPTSSGPVCHGESDAPCQLPEPGPGRAPMQRHEKQELLPSGSKEQRAMGGRGWQTPCETMPLRCPAAETETPGGGPVQYHARQAHQQAPDGPTRSRRVPSRGRGAGTFRAVTWWCSLTGGAGDAAGPESEAGGQASRLRGLP